MEKISLMITFINENPTEPLTALLRGLFPRCTLCAEPGWEVLLPAPGIIIQLCGPGAQAPEYLVTASQPVISYAVNNLQETVDLAVEHGACILQQTTDGCTGFTHYYLKFPDDQTIGVFSNTGNPI